MPQQGQPEGSVLNLLRMGIILKLQTLDYGNKIEEILYIKKNPSTFLSGNSESTFLNKIIFLYVYILAPQNQK